MSWYCHEILTPPTHLEVDVMQMSWNLHPPTFEISLILKSRHRSCHRFVIQYTILFLYWGRECWFNLALAHFWIIWKISTHLVVGSRASISSVSLASSERHSPSPSKKYRKHWSHGFWPLPTCLGYNREIQDELFMKTWSIYNKSPQGITHL